MNRHLFLVLLCAICLHADCVSAQTATPTSPTYRPTYADVKAGYYRSSRTLNDMRAVIRSSKYGETGLSRLYNNFEGLGKVDLSIPGVEKNLLLSVSNNPRVAQGARRTQLYANRIHNDPRFKLLALDEPTQTPLGRTDKDIRYRVRGNGVSGRIEVKDWSAATQRSKLSAIKTQLSKMAYSQQFTGEQQSVIFRKAVIPEIRAVAQHYGVPVYDQVATGAKTSLATGARPIQEVLDDLERRAHQAFRGRIVRSGGGVGLGLVTMMNSGSSAFAEYRRLQSADPEGNWYRFGHHTALATAGSGLVVAGTADAAALVVQNEAWSVRWRMMGRLGGGVATVAFLVAEGFLVAEYASGDISTRDFATEQAVLGGGLAGGLAGAWAGAQAGAAIGVWLGGPYGGSAGFFIGGLVGGVTGAYAGSKAGTSLVEMWYEFENAEHEQAFREYLRAYYVLDRMVIN